MNGFPDGILLCLLCVSWGVCSVPQTSGAHGGVPFWNDREDTSHSHSDTMCAILSCVEPRPEKSKDEAMWERAEIQDDTKSEQWQLVKP